LAPRSRALNAFYAANFDHESAREAEFVMGAVMLARRDAIDEVGLLDEDFFLFSEETDWCYRFRQAGWKVLFTPDSEFAPAYVAAVLVGLGISRLLPEHGFGLFLRLGAATLVVLLPGRLIARALGLRSTSATLAWTLAALSAALGIVFVVRSSFSLALWLLL